MKKNIDELDAPARRWLDPDEFKSIKPPKDFFGDLVGIIADDILRHIEWVRTSELTKLCDALYAITQYIAYQHNSLALYRKSKQSVRKSRVRHGRARRHVRHGLESLQRAERALRPLDSERFLRALNFSSPRKGLERLEKALGENESTLAAVIHPGLRTPPEKALAVNTFYKLHDSAFRISEGSAELQYEAVKLVDGQLHKFTGGKVATKNINKFISNFLEKSLGWTVTVKNINTMRHRIKVEASRNGISTESNSPKPGSITGT